MSNDPAESDDDKGVERADFDEISDSQPNTAAGNLDVVLNVNVELALEIGRTNISVHNLLQLNQGSVVELDRLAGEPLDVLVNGTLIAHGEVVVVNDKYGIRVTDVVSPSKRIEQFR